MTTLKTTVMYGNNYMIVKPDHFFPSLKYSSMYKNIYVSHSLRNLLDTHVYTYIKLTKIQTYNVSADT